MTVALPLRWHSLFCRCRSLVIISKAGPRNPAGRCIAFVEIRVTNPDLSFFGVMRSRLRAVAGRSLLLLVGIVLLAQGVNAYFMPPLIGPDLIAEIILCLKITLVVAVPFVLYVVTLQARADMLADHFRVLSRTDALTGLLNRRAFVESQKSRKHREAARKSFSGKDSRALLVIDLDHFKQVNDRFGHDAGDAILVQVADLFRINLRADDVVARLGGEEFAAALNRGTVQETWNVAQRLRHAVERNVFIYGENEIRLTISIGVVRYEGGKCFETALREADLLTYKSKKDGRNRVSYVDRQSGLATAA